MKKIAFLLALFTYSFLFSQEYHDFGFARNFDIPVFGSGASALANPWGGGINSVRASEIDLNFDGIKDLFLFEKNGNRILPYINNGIANEISYRYAPEYKHYFPILHDWVILKDYNGDGKEDIFTYGLAGITVYKNISDTALRFELVTTQLQSYYYNGYTNIFSSPDDYLVIEDIDNDGDIDLLNFMVLGRYVHFQKNYAIENSDNAENFDFRLADECWGKFAEGADDNSIELNVDCGSRDREKTRHVGSTILAYDYTKDGKKDILIGDIDYPEIVFLENGGTIEDALMVSQTTSFPNAVQPIYLYSMPAVTFYDLSNDGIDEIIASPADPSLVKSENQNSVWLYQYNNTSETYELQTRSFLQEDMIDVGSGAYPVLFDWNGDGLEDLFIANYGAYDSSTFYNYYLASYYSSSIAYYENIGQDTAPEFRWVTDDFGQLRDSGHEALYPVFGDFTGDGTIDLLCGNRNGNLLLFRNSGADGALPQFEESVIYGNISVENYSTPQYFDLDRDGKRDLLIGNRRGQIAYYRNVSTDTIPAFELITAQLGGVDVRDFTLSYFGYSVPFFFRTSDDRTVLFCANEQGKIAYYKNIDQNLDGPFDLVEDALFEVAENQRYDISEGIRAGLNVCDLNHDQFPDLLVGNYAGGISYFEGTTPPEIHISIENYNFSSIEIYPNPANEIIVIDGCIEKIKEICIYSVTGGKIASAHNCDVPFTLSTEHLSAGIYILRIQDQHSRVHTKKFIIAH